MSELKKLYQQDQKDRENWKEWGKSIPVDKIRKRDKQRLDRVLEIIDDDALTTGEDHYYAAMVLQHSKKTEHYKLANELCKKAINLGEERAKWLYAASLDRYMLNSERKFQKYGTQYKKNDDGWYLCPVDPKTTDEDRAEYNVPSLEELQAKTKEFDNKYG